jgi:thiol peroxidase
MLERANLQAFKGKPLTLIGESCAEVGKKAPDFMARKTLTEVVHLHDYLGKRVVLSSVPSIDTPVCERQTVRLNTEAASFGSDTVFLSISVDLPFAQTRWCGANEGTNTTMLSDFREHDFAAKFGLEIKELGLLARAIYIIDASGVVTYEQIVPEMSHEPDYAAFLAALKK